jgi:hypothetical protein
MNHGNQFFAPDPQNCKEDDGIAATTLWWEQEFDLGYRIVYPHLTSQQGVFS